MPKLRIRAPAPSTKRNPRNAEENPGTCLAAAVAACKSGTVAGADHSQVRHRGQDVPSCRLRASSFKN
ncbi:hypothetical protein K432DRAFT_381747 [Lepidopterella palustris CBS 459.81]|uniref:Uncharacterized protein n=1 Tax=Lepidopterella palustris CBS 459.81 TaxID=1314670 RepID=A0A8E2EBH6_9PEZI|nr:hypothetical protein K432DRAFT_381747 [Lepidopterella palustris CBS 459.81]